MTRIIGQLWGADGPLNGRLFVKAGGSFIGAPQKDLTFKVEDGIVDIELPPCPPGAPYFVDWKSIGDASRLNYIERWRVPALEEVGLDDVRGITKQTTARSAGNSLRKGELIENTTLRNEVSELKSSLSELESKNAKLLSLISDAESRAAAAQARAASLSSELTTAQRKIVQSEKKEAPVVVEKIVERPMTPDEYVQELAARQEQVELLRVENNQLKEENARIFSLQTHFAGLQSEIDRLNNEKQKLLRRIEDLSTPMRAGSALRSTAIANLDRLFDE